MKNDRKSFWNLFGHLRGLIVPFLFVAVVVAALAYVCIRSSAELSKGYADYRLSGKSYSDAAFLVGSNRNPLRVELNGVLADVLGRPMSRDERLALVRRGRTLLEQSGKQIDAIGDAGDVSSTTALKLDSVSKDLTNLYMRPEASRVIALSRERGAMIADIRGMSYKTNYYVSRIFDRIEQDGGELTQEHIKELNSRLPELEAEFDRRSNLYTDLEGINYKIDALISAR